MDLDLGKRLEEENQKELERRAELQQETDTSYSNEETAASIPAEEEEQKKKSSEGKFIVIALVIIVVIFIISMGGMKFYEQASATGASISYTLQELHQENLAGNLAPENGYVYNGFSVVKYNDLWYTRKEMENRIIEFPLHFGPKEVESIVITGNLDPKFNQGENVFIAIDPAIANKYYSLALSELSFNIVKGLNRKPIGSCTTEDPVCEGREIVSCNNTKGLPVIELVISNETGIYPEGTCIKIVGNEYELVKAVDKLLFQWYKVIS